MFYFFLVLFPISPQNTTIDTKHWEEKPELCKGEKGQNGQK